MRNSLPLLVVLGLPHLFAGDGQPVSVKQEISGMIIEQPTPPASADTKAVQLKTKQVEDRKDLSREVTILPTIIVRGDALSKLDQALQSQDKLIFKEEKLIAPTQMDQALNGGMPSIISFGSDFGDVSAQGRARLARQRVALLDDERIQMVALSAAKTKAEADAIRQELDETQLILFRTNYATAPQSVRFPKVPGR